MLIVKKNGDTYCVIHKADVTVTFTHVKGGAPAVWFMLAEGRAISYLTLQEFCELLHDIRKEIIAHDWQEYARTSKPQENATLPFHNFPPSTSGEST